MSAALAIAAIASAGIAGGSLGYGIYSGEQQKGAQQQALAKQTQAQQEAKANALSTERKSEVAQNAANQKTPDIASILQRAATMGNTGVSSTMLTGPGGVNTSNLNLGKNTLLGA